MLIRNSPYLRFQESKQSETEVNNGRCENGSALLHFDTLVPSGVSGFPSKYCIQSARIDDKFGCSRDISVSGC
jgi:hypothetical protein